MRHFLIAVVLVLGGCAAWAAGPQIPALNWEPRSDWVNVKQVTPAAVGDGVADDTAALQAALDRIGERPGDTKTVFLPAGTYRITKTLSVTKRQGGGVIGCGRNTRIVWDGAVGERMMWSNGAGRHRWIGLTWDGAGKAAIGVDHDSHTYYETRVRHEHEAFLNFTESGIRVGHDQGPPTGVASAEMMYWNCLFEKCGAGVSFLAWNDYDNSFDGCEFRDCGVGINCVAGNFYARSCHFERSSQADFVICPHSNSIRNCTSVGSAKFVTGGPGGATAELTVQNCRVDGWTAPDGAITPAFRGPNLLFDNVFTNPPNAQPPIRLANGAYNEQVAVVSNNTCPGMATVVDPGVKGRVTEVPVPLRKSVAEPVALTAQTSFLQSEARLPGKVFDVKRDFGAKGDGKADDTAALEAAIAAARAAGQGALAYLPSGRYLVTRTLSLAGGDYYVGGCGLQTEINWGGAAEGGPVFAVQDPQGVTLEQLAITAPAPVARVRQTGAGASRMTYDGVYVAGSWLKGGTPLRGLELADLPAAAVVLLPHLDGSLRVTNCAQATVLAGYHVDGVLTVEGAGPKSRPMSEIVRICSGNPYDMVVLDNQDLVVGDYYTEQTQHAVYAAGGGVPRDGHITIKEVKVHTEVPEPVTIENYQGRFYYGGGHWEDNAGNRTIKATGDRPLFLMLVANAWRNQAPKYDLGPGAKLVVLESNVTDDKLHSLPNALPPGGLQAVAAALDDFRQLFELDLRVGRGMK
ncbi:MAG TPA: glycosyl hydrolase family 28-related protein [Armatimonadota bacterium]|jgi:hypothetical protein